MKRGKGKQNEHISIVDYAFSPKNSLKNKRTSQHRLTLHPSRQSSISPPNIHPNITKNSKVTHQRKLKKGFLSKASSLEKNKSKPRLDIQFAKHRELMQRQKQNPTRETHESTQQEGFSGSLVKWKHNLKVTFRPRAEESLRNQSLKCMEQIYEGKSERSEINYETLSISFSRPFLGKNGCCLVGTERIFLVDWLSYVAASLMLKRETLHLAVTYLDAYLQGEDFLKVKLQILGAGALLLAVKQEQRGAQIQVLVALASCGDSIGREEVIEMESKIVRKLNFKLNFNTLSFWTDYFSQKWDAFIHKRSQKISYQINAELSENLIVLRDPHGLSYKYYRALTQIIDTLLMDPTHRNFDPSKLSLACLYLVIRVQTEIGVRSAQKEPREESEKDSFSKLVWLQFYEQFKKKASPIFRDPLRINQVFNDFTTQVCNFEMTEIIPGIRYTACVLNLSSNTEIDSRIYQSSQNYEQFIRYMTYSCHLKNHMIALNSPS